ncbi:MAG: protein translocase subunit SecD [Porticoccaceae bacterium]|nr:protein translocase subunit SecD [Porticoccaceae bacterium]
MNKYPIWKYLLILSVLAVAAIYAMPNIYPPDPAVQISGETSGTQISQSTLERAVDSLEPQGIEVIGSDVSEDGVSALIRLADRDHQLAANELIKEALGPGYVVALNLAPTTPQWLRDIGAQPMKLGLDLSGGVHFLLEVDIEAAVADRAEGLASQVRTQLLEEGIRYRTPEITEDNHVRIGFRTDADRSEARTLVLEQNPDLQVATEEEGALYILDLAYSELAIRDFEERALTQNLTSLKNRVNELGVAEPLVQRQGSNRIVVELPGIQDTAEAKRIIGKTANLEFRLEHNPNRSAFYEEFEFMDVTVGLGTARLDRDEILTGELVSDASTSFDESGRPQVNITLSSEGGTLMHRATRDTVGERMAVLFIEYKSRAVEQINEDGEVETILESYSDEKVISLATIQSALGVQFRITGAGSQAEASELALLLRAGALAAPMTFVEERTVGPSLGAENVASGIKSIQIGLGLVVLFMLFYYRVFGLFATVALSANLVLLTAVMSIIGATLTLPGIAGIVLTLGMAVDANVLIFSRIREELKNGAPPQSAIKSGYDLALSTIVDANLTTLIVALILYLIGSGPVQGFAVTLAVGIVTSMFTAILGSRALVNLTIGGRKDLKALWI